MAIDKDLIHVFLVELDDHISKWDEAYFKLDESRDWKSVEVGVLFRCAHNLKSGAQIVELDEFAGFLHKLEELLVKIKNGKLELSDFILDILSNASTVLRDCYEAIHLDPKAKLDLSELEEQISEALSLSPEEIAKALMAVPPQTSEASDAEVAPEITLPDEDINTDSLQQNDSQNQMPQLVQSQPAAPVNHPAASAQNPQFSKSTGSQKHADRDELVRVSLSRIDSLIQLVGELSVEIEILGHEVSLLNQSGKPAESSWKRCRKILRELQGTSGAFRMGNLQLTYQKLDKALRDVSRGLSKPVQFICEGHDTELDKKVIEKINEPLIHMIRNSVDHGIESPEQRKALGKNEIATVMITAEEAGGSVLLRLIDDGKGIDPEAVFKKAVSLGLIGPEAKLTDKEKIELIFLPGFSTATNVSKFSGRGVGMDVVKSAVDALNGKITIDSRLGKGTQFTLKLPSSISIVNALVVKIDNQLYGVPTLDIQEVIDLKQFGVKNIDQNNQFFTLRGKTVTVKRLNQIINMKNHKPDDFNLGKTMPAMVVEGDSSLIAFPVQKIVSQQRIYIKPPTDNINRIRGISGTALLANGEPSLVLNLPQLVRDFAIGA